MKISKIEEFEKGKNENRNFSKEVISIKVKTTEDVDQLIRLLSDDSLEIAGLILKVDDKVSSSFISKFINMEPKPKISWFGLPAIKLSQENWKIFFEGLPAFKELNELHLQNSNFEYDNDLKHLGVYLAGNPKLKTINLCNNDKIDNKTFKSGSSATQLLDYLKTNTNLICIKYGGELDDRISTNLSKALKEKLHANDLERKKAERILEYASTLQNDTFVQKIRTALEECISHCVASSLLKGTDFGKLIQVDKSPQLLSLQELNYNLMQFKAMFEIAKQDDNFSKSSQVNKITDLINYYHSQYFLIVALNKMHQQELKATPPDKVILQNLREDLLNGWIIAASFNDINEKNKKMTPLIERMLKNCDQASSEVKDRSSGALIKNVALILSAILTAGISLGIYAAVTKQTRAENGSFFFKNTELSKNKIDELKKNLEDVDTAIKKTL